MAGIEPIKPADWEALKAQGLKFVLPRDNRAIFPAGNPKRKRYVRPRVRYRRLSKAERAFYTCVMG